MMDKPDEARARAEAKFKKQEQQTKEGEKVWAEHAAAEQAADKNRARLRTLRLAKEAAEKADEAATPFDAKSTRRQRSKKST